MLDELHSWHDAGVEGVRVNDDTHKKGRRHGVITPRREQGPPDVLEPDTRAAGEDGDGAPDLRDGGGWVDQGSIGDGVLDNVALEIEQPVLFSVVAAVRQEVRGRLLGGVSY